MVLLQTSQDAALRSVTVHFSTQTMLRPASQINGFAFVFAGGRKAVFGQTHGQRDTLHLRDGEFLVRVAGRVDAGRPHGGAPSSCARRGSLVSVTLATSRSRELITGNALTYKEEHIFDLKVPISTEIVGLVTTAESEAARGPPIPTGLIERRRVAVGVRLGDPSPMAHVGVSLVRDGRPAAAPASDGPVLVVGHVVEAATPSSTSSAAPSPPPMEAMLRLLQSELGLSPELAPHATVATACRMLALGQPDSRALEEKASEAWRMLRSPPPAGDASVADDVEYA